MSTRHAAEGSDLSHERYCSAPEYMRGIVATAVAKKCLTVEDSKLIGLLWFLQQRSLLPGGLKRVAKDIANIFPERVRVAGALGRNGSRGKRTTRKGGGAQRSGLGQDCLTEAYALDRSAVSFSADTACNRAEELLDEELERACIDPRFSFPDIVGITRPLETLFHYRDRCIEQAEQSIAPTSVTSRVFEVLDFSFETRSMVLVEGDSRLGKSRSAKVWCDLHPGLARYVEVPASNDDRGFYVAIAESLGVARGTSYSGQQINLRVMDVLKEGHFMLVLDEAQFLWPQYNRPRGTPARIQWIKTMFDAGVPMALVAMPEFSKWQQLLVERTNWSDAQFKGRLSRYVKLPLLTEEDLALIARQLMPTGNVACIKLLVGYAISSKCNASAIAETLKSARYRAHKEGRSEVDLGDIKKAIQEDQLPTDRTIASLACGWHARGRNKDFLNVPTALREPVTS